VLLLMPGLLVRFCRPARDQELKTTQTVKAKMTMMSRERRFQLAGLFLGSCLVCVELRPQYAFSQPFYQGKTITIIQGREPGDAGDMRVKAAMPFLQKHIPGNPTIVSEYMPGGGGRKAANHIYKVAKADGLVLGNIGAGFLSNAVLGEAGVQYDIDKFTYLGSPYSAAHYLFLTRKELQLETLEKLKATPGIRIGAQAVGHTIYIVGRLFAWLLGLKDPKFVTAYAGNEIDLAMMRGELDGRAQAADWLLHRNRDWLDKRLVNFHAILEIPKGDNHSHFSSLSEIESFAKSEKERKVLAMQRGFRLAGSPFILPPGVPKERVEILQQAMKKALKDPGFPSEYKKLTGDDPTPLLPEENQKAVRELPREPETIELFKKIVGPGPLPPR
jgi:tripartite-type tricarboxylate transporter receptor subunit TctC